MLDCRNDERLVPVAFELYAPGTKANTERVVYSPKDPPQVLHLPNPDRSLWMINLRAVSWTVWPF